MTYPTPEASAALPSGVVQLSELGVIRAAGPDAASFLQGQLTQDVVSIGFDAARLAAFCSAKGRMQASFIVFKRKTLDETDEYLMVCSADILAQTLKRLSLFVMRAKVKLSDASADFKLYGLVAPAIDSEATNPLMNWARRDLEGQIRVSLYPGGGCVRVLCCMPAEGPPPAGAALPKATWEWLSVQSGIAMITQPIVEAFVPQMLNYESVGGVSFKKGCYPGQEVVARSQFRGTLKRRAYLLHGAGHAHVGQEVFQASDAGQPCGLVAACAANPAGGFDAIVSMQTTAATGAALTLGSPEGTTLHLLALPYPLLDDI